MLIDEDGNIKIGELSLGKCLICQSEFITPFENIHCCIDCMEYLLGRKR